ncbi:LacI family DNA-binding transcriptional regulator [Nocardioides euryhalodurans]|uniref:LacI family DNA-binding transcriptional regulator n=1 Tax=Nocardioides euryhalodurans TaxID=2518370 RepID=UPI001423DF2E|nr:LacI family DNA-binding transcriptional regulator [Nocardioides euryhalodurans]
MPVTIRDVASDAGVSVATVSRALSGNGHVGPATRDRIAEAARRLGYQPNDLARSLHGGATGTIAVLVPDITNPFFPELVAGIQAVANEQENLLLLCQTGEDPTTAVRELRHLRRKRVDGVVLVGGLPATDDLGAAVGDLPVVTVDRDAGWPASWSVRADHRGGGRMATEHLVELGHEQIAHIAGPAALTVAQERLAGHREALQASGIEPDESLVVHGDFGEAGGYDALRTLLRRRREFTAVFCSNDLAAVGALRALDEAGFRVPDDVSLVGFDDIHLARYLRPSLTTVRQPIHELGRRAATLLLEAAVGSRPEQHDVLDVELVRRDSTRPVRRGR